MARNRTRNAYNYHKHYNAYYSNTSEAHDLYAVPQKERVTERRKAKRRRGLHYEHALGTTIYPKFIYVVLSFVFVGCLLSIFAYSFVWSHARNVVSLQNQISLVKENIAILEADSTFNYDLQKIEEIAKTRLQMSFPEQHQIVYINVPNESYIEQYMLEGTQEASMSLNSVVNDFFKEWSNGTSKKR